MFGDDAADDNLDAVRRFKEHVKSDKEPLLEVRKGDIVVNQYGNTMIVLGTTTREETLKESVEYIQQSHPSEGRKSMTYDKLRKQYKLGRYKIYRGSSWSDADAD